MDVVWALGALWVTAAAAVTAGLAHASAHGGFSVERDLELHA